MKTIEETRRGMFEAWAERRYNWSMHMPEHETIQSWDGRAYKNRVVQGMWEAFNAALDAVVIELPEPHTTNGRDDVVYLCETITAIESTTLGLKIR